MTDTLPTMDPAAERQASPLTSENLQIHNEMILKENVNVRGAALCDATNALNLHSEVPAFRQGRKSTRTSYRSFPNSPTKSHISDQEFRNGLNDVHSEIDNLLGGMNGELQYWRTEFANLQDFWSRNCSAFGPNGEADPAFVDFTSLREFRDTLERCLEASEMDKDYLEKQLQEAQGDMAGLRSQLSKSQNEVQMIVTARDQEVKARQRMEADHASTFADLRCDIVALKSELSERTNETKRLSEELKATNEELKALRISFATSQDALKEERTSCSENQRLLGEARAGLQSKTDRLAQLEVEHRNLKAELDEKNNRIASQASGLSSKDQEIEMAQDTLKTREVRIKALQEENETMRTLTLDQSQCLSVADGEIADLTASLKREKAERQKLETARAASSQEVLQLREKLSQMESAWSAERSACIDLLSRSHASLSTDS